MPRCYNCNSPHHYSDNCPKPRASKRLDQKSECYTCHKFGHKSANCPSGILSIQQSLVAPLSNADNKAESVFEEQPKLTSVLKNSLTTKLLLGTMWGKNSVLLDANCNLYKLKVNLVDKLLINGVISRDDLDEQNCTPHINIKGRFDIYNKLHKTMITINNITVIINTNSINLEVCKNYHMTLIYKNNISNKSDIIFNLLDELIDQIKMEEEKKENNDELLCKICFAKQINIKLSPCNHVCLCETCAKMINKKCPVCRANVETCETIFL
jgi:hypothetical protein